MSRTARRRRWGPVGSRRARPGGRHRLRAPAARVAGRAARVADRGRWGTGPAGQGLAVVAAESASSRADQSCLAACQCAGPGIRPCLGHDQPPISTVGAPAMIGAPQPVRSPIRAAGCPPIRTVGHPGGMIGVGGCGGVPGNEQACSVPTVAAGIPLMMTVGTPGPVSTPGWAVGSPTRAAGGITGPFSSSSDVVAHRGCTVARTAGRRQVEASTSRFPIGQPCRVPVMSG